MEEPLSPEETLHGLHAVCRKIYKESLPDRLIEAIERMMELAKESTSATQELNSFCKESTHVKLTEYKVPDIVLPVGYSATLFDAKVKCKGPDDTVYKNNPKMRRLIARGTTMIQLEGPESYFDTVVYANKKFIGGVGDEDETQPENDLIWQQYCLQPPEVAKEVVCMTKLNGEAAHFSGRYIGGKFYIFTGSKNTHMMIKKKEEVDLYSDSRFSVARTVAKAVCEALEEMDPSRRHWLFSFLHHTKCTAVCEILQPDYQHIVELSYLEKPEINFIAFTPTASQSQELSLTALPPHHNLDLIRALNLKCADYTIINSSNILAHRDEVRAQYCKEGEVFYYLNNSGETIGIAKAKTVWYILLRALREKVVYSFTVAKKNGKFDLTTRTNAIFKRFNEIRNWLHFSDSCLQQWKDLAKSFMLWLNNECSSGRLQSQNIRPRFPVIWRNFLDTTESNDKIPS
ncbi:hypothetical protein SK128_008883 [Halocaridina rubra]|uniref:DUF7920 domain-containing protein n=1 Tax=Halocaridina rubra TaxID=373956 RepID=A0AAN8X7K2_HALRR